MLEKVWYELSPMIYLAASVIVMIYTNHLAAFFGVLLLLTSALIGIMRYQARIALKTKAKVINSRNKYRKSRI